ncbi:glycoside hydrolase family 6 protein [Nocardioides sp. zg-536]|uniref:Glucanase n=1 Tax=Nocardioides faecalis TaxID=2803858 RepID=A0A938Y2N1_9ACTN|nr:glycoside hydrolase family 6 protein [Nocardioides faecalis]MBM9460741.1 glycoside hydrolase family 6 protein [Nocardioides faecalis]MBS4752680.1 glycoside hydrolase family 6 protein [Nocardioides faecalis]QVI57939.1 glycoside hydrolase family 6 protein [Nocardioides faecalis]
MASSARPSSGPASQVRLLAFVALLSALVLTSLGTGASSLTQAASAADTDSQPRYEVWQRAEAPYDENRSNPLANRVWGVYQGPQDQLWRRYQKVSPARQARLDTIALRPRTKWYGSFVADRSIRSTVRSYIASSQAGDPDKLVQIAVFRMEPWEHAACKKRTTAKQKKSYKRWIVQLAAGIGATPTLVVMQPDGPFLWCAPDRRKKAKLLAWATKRLSALPRTSVYIDAGAADWCENDKGADPERCAGILKQTGIAHARGFALDSTHYTGPSENIRHGARIVQILKRDGYGTKHFIIDTAKSGRPTPWSQMIPSRKGGAKDDARVCRSRTMTRCVALGIPPTVRVADERYGLSADDRVLAKQLVDGFVWFGRPWLYMQADPFVLKRGLALADNTPWPGPKRD